jgi:sulfite exporter TauE/SafE
MKGFLLGLSNGTACLAFCAPVLVPYWLSATRSARHHLRLLSEFLLGRLLGYLAFGVVAWWTGGLLASHRGWRECILGASFLVLSPLLCAYGFRREPPQACAPSAQSPRLRWLRDRPGAMPMVIGCLTGLSLCPPFLLAWAAAAASTTLGESLLFFLTFFLGTSIYFIPTPFLGALARFEAVRIVGRLSMGLAGAYYFYSGIILLRKGMELL